MKKDQVDFNVPHDPADVDCLSKLAAGVSEGPQPSLDQIKQLVQTDPAFSAFKTMLSHVSLLKFIYNEKSRYPILNHENREVVDQAGHGVGGYRVNFSCPDDRYHPKVFKPFELKGVYLPLDEGEIFSGLSEKTLLDNPLIKVAANGARQMLFLIHPRSEAHYATLLETYQPIAVQALSLSSARSLLVALPEGEDFVPALVKVSLDVELGGLNRLLTHRECAMSVGNSVILQNKLDHRPDIPLTIMQDTLAFVPEGYESGMLYRQLPSFMDPSKGQGRYYAAPFLSLMGVANADFFRLLVVQNASTTKDFLFKVLYEPFVTLIIELLYKLDVSLECHGQNLLAIYDHDNQFQGLMYRDMGGVNQIMSDAERASLPANLQSSKWYYESTHQKDASHTLERHFVQMLLFPLTKQLVKDSNFPQAANDVELQAWLSLVSGQGRLKNWAVDVEGGSSNLHAETLLESEFSRYGYVEYQFAFHLIDRLKEEHLIDDKVHQTLIDQLLLDEKIVTEDGRSRQVAPCSNVSFFDKLIHDTLPKSVVPTFVS